MEVYKRTIGYEQLGRTNNLVITATTFNVPFMLKQSFEDIGIYTDTDNPVYEIVDLSGVWNLSNNGSGQKPCLTLNNCTISINETLPITYFGASNGQLTSSVTSCPSPQTILWSGPNGFSSNSPVISSLITGNYTLKVIDANCDISYASYFLQQPQGLSFNMITSNSQTNANIGCNGSASVTPQGGLPPYTYTWYSGSTIIAGPSTTLTGITSLCAGVYTVQIADSTPTIVSAVFTITQPSAVSGTVVSTVNINCFGGNTGVITLTAAGGVAPTGYTYILSGPSPSTNTGGNFTGLLQGVYTAQIFDGVGNFTTVGPITITQPTAVSYSIPPPTLVSCFGAQNGSITITPSGGVAPYALTVLLDQGFGFGSYLDTSISGSYVLSGLDVGYYKISLKDTNNCPATTTTTTITQRPQFSVGLNSVLPLVNGYNISCFGNTIPVVFGTLYTTSTFAPFIGPNLVNYYINGVGPQTPSPLSNATKTLNLSAGTFNITAVDSGGCSATTQVTITQPPMPLTMTLGMINAEDDTCGSVLTPVIPGGPVICNPCGCGNCRQAIIDINGGVHPYTILWSDGSTLLTSNSHCTGTILTVTVTDANGCLITSSPITLV